MKLCERCGRTPAEAGSSLLDYCGICSKDLCPECMDAGCCGKVPAESGTKADYGDEEDSEDSEDSPDTPEGEASFRTFC